MNQFTLKNNNDEVVIIDKNRHKLYFSIEEAYQLCNELEQILFEDKPYKELEEEVLRLELKIGKLEEQLQYYEGLFSLYSYYHGL